MLKKKEIHHSLFIPSMPSYTFIDHYYIFLLLFSFQTEEIIIYLITHYEETQNSFRILTGTLGRDH